MNIAFRGKRYHGWQIQPSDISVQQTLEVALKTVLRVAVPITGAGRTDAGVNARIMPAHFDLDECLDTNRRTGLCRALNAICRPDIVVREIAPVHADAHARFDATLRTYRYFAHTQPDPFVYPLSWQAPPGLDFAAMNRAAELLIGTRDFTSFSKLHTNTKTNICTVSTARWVQTQQHEWYFEISADRFLRNMVRAVVGTLVDVGRHKLEPSDITAILEAGNRCSAGTSMPAHALFLWNVQYPYPVFEK